MNTLQHTPTWVYLLFLFLMSRGVKSMKTRKVKINGIFLLPSFFFIWGCFSIFKESAYIVQTYIFMALGVVSGSVLSWPIWNKTPPPEYLPIDNEYIEVAGSPLPIIFIIFAFIIKFYLGVEINENPSIIYCYKFNVFLGVLTGIIDGCFCSRTINLFYRLKTTKKSE
ncbi:hypothetical protein GK48_27765 [Salmonella enterica subsp. diarizonae]|nr:hypothetical protein [Salmonella enterica subsp. diarizonae]